jgi:hypothetical protein
MRTNSMVLALVIIAAIVTAGWVMAENIDPEDDGARYAYCENIGWLNAKPLGDGGPGVDVGHTKLTGYLWAENIGWVSLSCENTGSCSRVRYGVTNDGEGNLSGYAWSENAGWISFSCKSRGTCGTVDYGVAIDPVTGEFSGRAWGENIGWVSFRSQGAVPFGVTTSWVAPVNDCYWDNDNDGDVDPLDLVANRQALVISSRLLSSFALEFGRADCFYD